MNPNAPEHQPYATSDEEIITEVAAKIFSPTDPEIAPLINAKIKEFNDVERLRHKVERENKTRDLYKRIPVPKYPPFSTTASPTVSNTSKGTVLNLRQGLRALDIQAGTPNICTDVYIQLVVDYANLWHSKNSGIDCRSPGTDPKFFYLGQNFYMTLVANSPKILANQVLERLSRAQFWKLRYLFLPISFIPDGQDSAHVAACVISPEAKTVDYICSGGDSGLPVSPRPDGNRCLPKIFSWLAELVGPSFAPSEWKLRTGAGNLQNLWRGDCGVYTVTHIMALAFGYGYGDELGAFPKEHQFLIMKRRKRYVQDLLLGFKLYEEGSDNLQYYPLLDTPPTALESEGFHALPDSIIYTLPTWLPQPLPYTYASCPNKATLRRHCKRNFAFYPGYHRAEISGKSASFESFEAWVENMDKQRKLRGSKSKVAELMVRYQWVEPTFNRLEGSPRTAFWVR